MNKEPVKILITWPDRSYDPVYQRVISTIFPAPNYEWLRVNSIEATLNALDTNSYDIIITLKDISAANDGIELCRALRTEQVLKHTSIPIIIGWVDIGNRRTSYYEGSKLAIEAGANGCFGRVFDISGVQQMVEILLADPTRKYLHDQEISYNEAYKPE